MSDLSPAAQAVMYAYKVASDGYYNDSGEWIQDHEAQISDALRAAADQVVIKLAGLGQESAWYLEEIATELEA